MTTLERTMDAALYALSSPFSDRVYKEDVRLHSEVDDFLELHAQGLTIYQRHQRESEEHPEWDKLVFYRTATFGKLIVYYEVSIIGEYDNVRKITDSIVRYGKIFEFLAVISEDDGKPIASYWVGKDSITHIGRCEELYTYPRKEVEDELYRSIVDALVMNRDGPTTLRLEG